MNNRGKYDANLLRKQQKNPLNTDGEKNVNSTVAASEMDALLDSMKNIVITDENIKEVKQHLTTTRSYRDQLLRDTEVDLLEMFPYFFVKTELVCIPKT